MKLFYEKYIKIEHIGRGANADVFKVKHAEWGDVRAIKVLNNYIESKNDRAYESFLKECKTLLAIGSGQNPNILRIYGADLIDNHAIVEMDYVQGKSLYSYVKEKGFFDYEEVESFIHDIVGALAYTHHDIYKFLKDPEEDNLQLDPNDGKKYIISREKEAELVKKYGIAHNDLHSNNVMRRDYDGRFILLDFGLAVQDGKCIKSSGKADGHPEYMAPEKFDSGDITPRSDVYSLGVLIFEVLTGRPPFILEVDKNGIASQRANAIIRNEHLSQTPPSIFTLRKEAFETQIPGAVYERDYPEWLDGVIMKCLAKKPEDRYADAKELLDDINRHFSQEKRVSRIPPSTPKPSEDTPKPPIPPEPSRSKKKKILPLVIAGCVIAMTAVAVLLFVLLSGKDRQNYVPVQEIMIPQNEYSLNVGDSMIIIPKIFPSTATDTIIVWNTSNPEIAMVRGNTVIALKRGDVILSASTEDGKVTKNVSVKVSDISKETEESVNDLDINSSNGSEEETTNKEETKHENSNLTNSQEQKNNRTSGETMSNETDQRTFRPDPESLEESINWLLNGEISKETRLLSIPNIMDRYFDNSAVVLTIGSTGLILETENVEDFLQRLALSNTNKRIFIIETIKSEDNKKIIELRVKENHE